MSDPFRMYDLPIHASPNRLSTRSAVLISLPIGVLLFALQILVFRVVEQQVGASAPAFTFTVAGYMLGMGVGSSLFTRLLRFREDGRTPLRVALVLQALCAGGLLATLVWPNPGIQASWLGSRLTTLLVSIPAAVAAGLAFPALAASAPSEDEKAPALVFGALTLGGAVGVAATALAGIELLGVATCLGVVAAGSLALYAVPLPGQDSSEPIPRNGTGPAEHQRKHMALALLLGFTGMGLELAVFRLLTPVMGLSLYAMAGTVIPFLLGLGLGGMLASRWTTHPKRALAWASLCVTLLFAPTLYFLDRVPGLLVWLSSLPAPGGATWATLLAARLVVACFTVIPGAIALGTLFPLLLAALPPGPMRASSTSTLYGMNLVGSVLGPLVVNLYLVERLGVYGAFRALLALYPALSVLFLVWLTRGVRKRVAVYTVALIAASIAVLWPYRPDDLNVHAGAYWAAHLYAKTPRPPLGGLLGQEHRGNRLLATYDGAVASVLVVEKNGARSLVIDGKPASHTAFDQPTQVTLARIPLTGAGNARQVLVIGWGSGQTVAEALRFPVERVVCVEISREVLRAAPWFSKVNQRALADARLEIVVDDARHYLETTRQAFDVIISQPSNPWVGFSGGLFTREFLETCRRHLAPGGRMTQWFQYYGATPEDVEVFLRTFSGPFPAWRLWRPNRGDLVLVGERERTAGGRNGPLSGALATSWNIRLPDGTINTDDRPVLIYRMARHILTATPFDLGGYLASLRIPPPGSLDADHP